MAATGTRGTAVGKYAAARRLHPDDTATHTELLRTVREERLLAEIRKAVDGWPPLTDEQRSQLALLLAPGGGAP